MVLTVIVSFLVLAIALGLFGGLIFTIISQSAVVAWTIGIVVALFLVSKLK